MELLSSLHYYSFMPNYARSSVKIQGSLVVRSSMQCRKAGNMQVPQVAARPGQVDIPASDTSAEGTIKWGRYALQGPRSDMEDDIVLRVNALNGFTYAAVFDGQLEETGDKVDSGSTATVMFVGGDRLIVSHVGDSSVVLSRSGKAEVLTSPHRPYGNEKASLEEIRRIKEAGGWVINGRICGDISVSRAFGDMRFKTKKKEMLEGGVQEGKWTRKFVSRIKLNGDWVTATPDISHSQLGSDAEFILLASDGLWDCMKSVDAVKFVRNQLRQHGDVQCACEALAKAALDRNTQDNVSIVIADFGRIRQQDGPEEEQNFGSEIGQAAATVGIVSLGFWLSSLFGQEFGG